MVSASYKAYIASPRWKIKREAYWRKYGRFCRACNSTKNLQVHHLTYDRFGKELLTDLMGLCATCHRTVTKLHWQSGRNNLRMTTLKFVAQKRLDRFKQ